MHIQIGNSYLDPARIVWVAPFRSRPIIRMLNEKREQVTDLTQGKRVQSVIFTDTPQFLLTSEPVEAILEMQKSAIAL